MVGLGGGSSGADLCYPPAAPPAPSLSLLVPVAAKMLPSLGAQAPCSVTAGSALPWMSPSCATGTQG